MQESNLTLTVYFIFGISSARFSLPPSNLSCISPFVCLVKPQTFFFYSARACFGPQPLTIYLYFSPFFNICVIFLFFFSNFHVFLFFLSFALLNPFCPFFLLQELNVLLTVYLYLPFSSPDFVGVVFRISYFFRTLFFSATFICKAAIRRCFCSFSNVGFSVSLFPPSPLMQ